MISTPIIRRHNRARHYHKRDVRRQTFNFHLSPDGPIYVALLWKACVYFGIDHHESGKKRMGGREGNNELRRMTKQRGFHVIGLR